MGSPWSPRRSFAPRCLTWLEPDCRCWSTPNFPAQSIKPQDACETRIGGAIRLICNRGRRRTSSLRAELSAPRPEGLPVSVETCPHYLHFCAEEIPDGATLFKCAPPIRSRDNREKLWHGLKDGVIDLVATDHSPCPPAMKRIKEGNFSTAWGGISGISLALPIMWTEASRRHFALT